MTQTTQCLDCDHYRLDGTCTAFPLGIPDKIFYAEFKHDRAFPGDDGIMFSDSEDFDIKEDYALYIERQTKQVLAASDEVLKQFLHIMGLENMTVEELRAEYKD